MGFLPKRDSSRNRIPPETGYLPKLEGNFFFGEESRFGRNPVSGGIPFREESRSGGISFREESRFGRNPVSGGIPFREESRFGRNPVSGGVPREESSLGGVPVGRDPGWEEFRGRNHMGGILYGRNPNGTI